MHRPERRAGRSRRAWAPLLVVAVAAATVGNASAQAQSVLDTGGGSSDLASQFGSFKLESHGEGLSFTYDSPGLIPGTPSPIFAASLPESLTNMDSGPSSYALASLVYPGPLVADLPSVLALGGVPDANQIPAYPVRAQAFFPAGPTATDASVGPGRQTVSTSDTTSDATTAFGAAQLPPILDVGNITSVSNSHLEQGAAVSRTRVELDDVDLMAGLIHMDAITTDLVANSNGTDAATAGTTTVSGLTVLGLPATIDPSGVHLTAPPSSSSSSAGPLAPIGSALQPLGDALTQLMTSVIGAGNTDINQLLAASGIQMKLLEPTETKTGADANRLASGLLITITYNGSTEPVLSNLLNLIPIESLPSQGIGPIPFTSPQSIVVALKATHVETIGLAAANVRAAAAQPFTTPSFGGATAPTGTLGTSATPGTGGFSTPAPSLGGGNGGGGGGGAFGNALPIGFADTGPLAAAVIVLLAALAAGFAGAGGGRLADNVLAAASSSCPEGLDRAPASGGRP